MADRSRSRSPLQKNSASANEKMGPKSGGADQTNNAGNKDQILRIVNIPHYWSRYSVTDYILKHTDPVDKFIGESISFIRMKNKVEPHEKGFCLVTFKENMKMKKAFGILKSVKEQIDGLKLFVYYEKEYVESVNVFYQPLNKRHQNYVPPYARQNQEQYENPAFAMPFDEQLPVSDNLNTFGLSIDYLTALNIKPPLTRKIFVRNLDSKYDTEEKVRSLFSLAGNVASVRMIRKGEYNQVRVEYDHPVEAVQAVAMFNNQEIYSRALSVVMDSIVPLPDGMNLYGPGLGDNGEPMRGVFVNLEIRKARSEISDEIQLLRDTIEELRAEVNNLHSYQQNHVCNQNEDSIQNPMAALGNLLQPIQLLQSLMQSSAGNMGSMNPLFSAFQNWSAPNTAQNMPGVPNLLGPNMLGGPNMQEGPNMLANSIIPGGPNMQVIPNMQGGPNNMQGGPNNMQGGPNNMQGGPNNMQGRPNNMQGGLNMQGGPNMLGGPNMQGGPNNMQGALNLQGGPNIMQSGPNMHTGLNMQGGPNNMQGGPNNMSGGLNLQGGPNMQGGRNLQGGPNMQGGPNNMQGGSNIMPGGPNNMQGGPNNMQGGPNNMPGGPNNMPGGPNNMQGGPNNMPGGPNNMQGGPNNMQGGPNNMPGGPNNMQGGPNNMPGGPNNMQGGTGMHGGHNMLGGPNNMQGGPNNMQSGPNMQGGPNRQFNNNMPANQNQHVPSHMQGQNNNSNYNMQSGSQGYSNTHSTSGSSGPNSQNSMDYGGPQFKANNDKGPTATMVLFRNLPGTVTLQALQAKMREVGDVKLAEMTGAGRALISFYADADAERCIHLFNQSKVDNQTIEVRKV